MITGAASGIGLAAAERFVDFGMKVCMADANVGALEQATAKVLRRAWPPDDAIGVPTDVASRAEVERLKDARLRSYSARSRS